MTSTAGKVEQRELRYAAIGAYKVARGCENPGCPLTAAGIPLPAYQLDLDHLDQLTKVANVSALCGKGAPWDVIWTEVAKCRVLCCYCHRNWTLTEQRATVSVATAEAIATAVALGQAMAAR